MTRDTTAHHGSEPPGAGERRSAAGSGSGKTRPEQERRSGILMTPQQLATRRAPSYFEGPKSTLIALCVLGLLAVVFLGVGYSRPLLRTGPLNDAYRQSGTFSYSAAVNAPTAVYPSGAVKTGDPVYPSLVGSLGLNFMYHFASPLPHHVLGTIQLRTLVLSSTNTWKSLTTATTAAPFTGDTASVSTTLALSGLYALINTVSAQSGVAGANYAVDVQPVVRITGTVGGNPIKATFLPVLPFQVAPTALTLDVPVAPAPPGATYVAPTAASALAAGLNPTQPGSVPHIYPNMVSVAKYAIRVSLLRTSGLVFAVLAILVAVLHDVLRRRMTMRSDEELIARQVGSLIVPVDRLADTDGSDRLVVLDFAHLAGLAHYLERPILYEMKDGQRRYEVDDETRRYVYQPESEMNILSDAEGAAGSTGEDSGLWSESDRQEHRARRSKQVPRRFRRLRRPQHVLAARVGAGIVVLLVTVTLVTSFTASTNVPTSNVGRITQARLIMQLAPAVAVRSVSLCWSKDRERFRTANPTRSCWAQRARTPLPTPVPEIASWEGVERTTRLARPLTSASPGRPSTSPIRAPSPRRRSPLRSLEPSRPRRPPAPPSISPSMR